MDDLMEKLSGILSDKESVQQLSELAQMFMSGQEEPSGGEGPQEAPDLSAVMKLSSLAGAMSAHDPKADLLLALKPHLGEERQRKVDKAVKLLKLIALWKIAKENGLLSDII
ncbi:MAG: hypothetical protein IJ071_02580 [Ruminococcus sp.]|nr:hypothetical protein [Ruminococcus sp.]